MASVEFSSAEYAVPPASTAILTIERAGSMAGAVTVGYSTTDGTAAAGTDYVATSGTVSWSDGDSSAKTVSVAVTSKGGGKRFALGLTSVEGNADFGTPAAATIEISAGTTATVGSTSSSSSGGSSGSKSSSSSSSSSSGGSKSSSSSSSSGSGTSSSASVAEVTLSWAAPKLNTNGTALTNLSGYVISYGNSVNAMTKTISINTSAVHSCVITGLAPGTWYFFVVAVNAAGQRSNPSALVSTTM